MLAALSQLMPSSRKAPQPKHNTRPAVASMERKILRESIKLTAVKITANNANWKVVAEEMEVEGSGQFVLHQPKQHNYIVSSG